MEIIQNSEEPTRPALIELINMDQDSLSSEAENQIASKGLVLAKRKKDSPYLAY